MKNNKKRAIYSGTFDPITKGHLDIIKRGLKVYDEIIIAVADSSSKKPMFNLKQRIKLIKLATTNIENIKIKPFKNLMVDFAKNENVYNIIRGLRTNGDFEYELQLLYANRSLDKNFDTIFIMPTLKNSYISSTVVRELIKFNGDYSHLVSKKVNKKIKKYIKKRV